MAGNWSDNGIWYLDEQAPITVEHWDFIVDKLIEKGLMTMDDRVKSFPENDKRDTEGVEKKLEARLENGDSVLEAIENVVKGKAPAYTAKRLEEGAKVRGERFYERPEVRDLARQVEEYQKSLKSEFPGDDELVSEGFKDAPITKSPPSKLEGWPTPAEQAGLASKLQWVQAGEQVGPPAGEHWIGDYDSSAENAPVQPDMPTSPLEDFIRIVMEGVNNLDVGVNITWQPTTFVADFTVALRLVNGIIVANHRTSKISRGATNAQINREAQVVKDAIVLEIAQRAFVSDFILIQHALMPKLADPEYQL
ncbi:MAG: hypothetical protein ACYSWP_07095 [Planctomycetota bacterium]|jgi:hypothetical protein